LAVSWLAEPLDSGMTVQTGADNPTKQVLLFVPESVQAMPDTNEDCLFCRIIRGEIPAKKVYENEQVFAFEDIDPKAPTHVLVVPKKHLAGLKEARAEDAEWIGRCHLAAAHIARQRSIENGYRTVLNVGPGAGQSVFHLHVHLLGGRALGWPPG
jgi:histidine triad (HIT) family protein